jgi:arsenite methyltransferase
MTASQPDMWSEWLLKRRFGGDPQRLKEVLNWLSPVRDKVLSHVKLGEGQTLLDVGCGDGLIAFGALDKFPHCRVIFSDISDDLLHHAEQLAHEMKVNDRCQFVHASADDLSMFADGSIDAVTTRSVLIYVAAKQRAFNEFYRVLRPNGVLSIFEPINRFGSPEPPDRFGSYDVSPVVEIANKVKAVYDSLQPVDIDPMVDFDERDLIACAEQAGFRQINLELQAEIKPPDRDNWNEILHTAGNPKIPTLEEAMQQVLTLEEMETFSQHLRPLVESRQGVDRRARAYLWANKQQRNGISWTA